MDILDDKNLVNYVNKIKSMTPEDRIVYLSTYHPEWIVNKILSDYYRYNDVILSDGELLKLIEDHRVGWIPREGLSSIDYNEVWYLMKAWKSQQYHRFMCHIINRYINPINRTKIRPVCNEDNLECCICWRGLNSLKLEEKYTNTNAKDLAFTSDNTRTCLCQNCLSQLFRFSQLMSLLEDKDFNKLME